MLGYGTSTKCVSARLLKALAVTPARLRGPSTAIDSFPGEADRFPIRRFRLLAFALREEVIPQFSVSERLRLTEFALETERILQPVESLRGIARAP